MIKKLLLLLLLFPLLLWSQNDSIVKGKIVSEIDDLECVHIINISTIAATVSDKEGYFTIKAKVSDTILFSAVFLERKKYIIKKEDVSQKLFLVTINPNTEYLKEVTVTKYPNINAVSLGILQKAPKSYTPAERKLRAAGTFKWYSPLLIPLGGMSVDGLINAISGRTNMLKKELLIERKELLQEKTLDYFNKGYMINTLLIPEEYVGGFLFYIDDNVSFATAMRNENKTQATFILHQLAVDYLNLKEIPLKLEDRKPVENESIKDVKNED